MGPWDTPFKSYGLKLIFKILPFVNPLYEMGGPELYERATFGTKKIASIFSLVILHRIYYPLFEFPKKVFSEPVYCTAL